MARRRRSPPSPCYSEVEDDGQPRVRRCRRSPTRNTARGPRGSRVRRPPPPLAPQALGGAGEWVPPLPPSGLRGRREGLGIRPEEPSRPLEGGPPGRVPHLSAPPPPLRWSPGRGPPRSPLPPPPTAHGGPGWDPAPPAPGPLHRPRQPVAEQRDRGRDRQTGGVVSRPGPPRWAEQPWEHRQAATLDRPPPPSPRLYSPQRGGWGRGRGGDGGSEWRGGGLHAEPQLYPTREGGWVPDW